MKRQLILCLITNICYGMMLIYLLRIRWVRVLVGIATLGAGFVLCDLVFGY